MGETMQKILASKQQLNAPKADIELTNPQPDPRAQQQTSLQDVECARSYQAPASGFLEQQIMDKGERGLVCFFLNK